MATELDYMEYATDAAARTAYVSNAGFDSYTKLLLHCNGADASTSFIDETGKTVTAYGNAQIDTAQSKFGGASGLFDGTGDYLTVPNSSDFAFGTGDFTFDFNVRYFSIPAFSWFIGGSTGNNFDVWYAQSASSVKISLVGNEYLFAWFPSVNTWYHIAIARDAGNLRVFVDGTQIGTTQSANINCPQDGVIIGSQFNHSYFLDGWLDELRISKGIARWTANFTPPNLAYYKQLDIFSEATIKTQGLYSLKGIAAITDSLNKTLTRTII